ncbi:TonB-dependent receptor, partial [Pseudomonas chengduensis]
GKNLTRSTLALAVVGAMSSFAMANETIETTKEKETTQLQTIVVSASGFEQDIKKAAASISVLSQEEIGKKAYRDVTD